MLKPVTGTNTGVNKLLVGQVIGHTGEHTTIILLNVHTVKSTLSDLSLYPQINASHRDFQVDIVQRIKDCKILR